MPQKNHPVAMIALATVAMLALSMNISAQIPGYPDAVREAFYASSRDDSQQPTLIWPPQSDTPVPLLFALHTWSSDYRQAGDEAQYAMWCQQAGWAFVHPNFRGINNTPQSLGSEIRLTIITGGHEMVHDAALNWLAAQSKGKPVNWNPDRFMDFHVDLIDQTSEK